ncbi:MAG: protein phosphatase CheZ [Gammaproteobacteria bacterium]
MLEAEGLITEDNLARVKDLLATMEAGDEAGVKEVLDELTHIRESDIYQEMGKLTRELHDAIKTFGMDDQIVTIAEQEIPDARARLKHVIDMTDKAANRTMDAVEASLPICEGMETRSSDLHQAWQRFTQRDMDVNEFRALSKELDTFLEANTSDASKVKASLNEVLMAQDFQDLTSQIIKRVIGLVEQVEDKLIGLVSLTGEQYAKPAEKKEKSNIEASGPAVPGLDDAAVVSGQDEVDDLLSSLGF